MPSSSPKHAQLWLPPDQQIEWIDAKKEVPFLLFAAFMAFNVLARISLRILNRKQLIKSPINQALLQHGAAAITHAVISLMASFYLLMRRDLSHCGTQAFCHDDMSARLWTVHAGFCLFEFVFWSNHGQLVLPWNEMVLLHNVVFLLMAVVSLMYPARLSLLLLPLHQLLQLASLVDCVRRFASIYGAPWHLRFKIYLAFMAAFAAKAVAAAGMAAFTFYWIRSHGLWTLDLPEGMSMFNPVYGIVWLAGGVILAMIYIKWLGGAVAMTNRMVEQVQGKGKQAAADADAKGSSGRPARVNHKKQRQRR